MNTFQALKLLRKIRYRAFDMKNKKMYWILGENSDKSLNVCEEGKENRVFKIKSITPLQFMKFLFEDSKKNLIFELDLIKSDLFENPLLVSFCGEGEEPCAQILFEEKGYQEGEKITFEKLGDFEKIGTLFELKKILKSIYIQDGKENRQEKNSSRK